MKSINYTLKELKQAQVIISDHILHSLLQNPTNTKIRLGSLGYFIKKERQTENSKFGNVYYYHCGFKKSASLKRALDQQVENEMR